VKLSIFQLVTKPVCARYRFDYPAADLANDPAFQISQISNFSRDAFSRLLTEADILLIQRLPLSPQIEKALHRLKKNGVKLIFDLDDDLLNLSAEFLALKSLSADFPERILNTIKLCDAVQCSTEPLAQELRKHHSNVYVLENQLAAVPDFTREVKMNQVVRICYAAGENHYADWLGIAETFNQTLKKLKTVNLPCEVLILGDKKIFAEVETGRKQFFPLLGFEDYLKILGATDISLMPLQNSKFNESKSDIKFLESAAQGATVLASRLVYEQTVEDGLTGVLFENPVEFSEKLKWLVLQNEARLNIAKQAPAYVLQERLIAKHIEKWANFYRNVAKS